MRERVTRPSPGSSPPCTTSTASPGSTVAELGSRRGSADLHQQLRLDRRRPPAPRACSTRRVRGRSSTSSPAFDAVQPAAAPPPATAPDGHHHERDAPRPRRPATRRPPASSDQVADPTPSSSFSSEGLGRRQDRARGKTRSTPSSRDGIGAMRRNELTIGSRLGLVGLLVAFWLLVLGPKRQEASSLKDDVNELSVAARPGSSRPRPRRGGQKSFPVDYRKLVVLGKAVPEDADQSSLLVQLQQLADRSGVEFQSIDLAEPRGSRHRRRGDHRPRRPRRALADVDRARRPSLDDRRATTDAPATRAATAAATEAAAATAADRGLGRPGGASGDALRARASSATSSRSPTS